MCLFLADSDSRLEHHGFLRLTRATDSGSDGLASFGFGETKVRKDAEQQRRVEIADVAHVVSKAEIDGVAFALHCAFSGTNLDHQLLDDGIVGHAAIGQLSAVTLSRRRTIFRRRRQRSVRIQSGRNGQRFLAIRGGEHRTLSLGK